MAVKPNEAYIGTEVQCDWCDELFIVAERNQICDGEGNWLLNRCDPCTED